MFWRKGQPAKIACCEGQPLLDPPSVAETCPDGGCALSTEESDSARCPVSGTFGRKVDLITVKALINAKALRHLNGRVYRYCPAVECDVVYFDSKANSIFRKGDLTVRVGQKEKEDPIPICYCFNLTVADIRRDIGTSGKANIPSTIRREVKAGHCACEVKNPQGRCCLGDVAEAVKSIEAEISSFVDKRTE